MRQYSNRLYRVCKAVIVGAMVIGRALRSMRRFGVMPEEYRRPAWLFAELCHNAFVRKRGKGIYAVGKKRRPFRLKQSYARHSFSANARVLRACTKAASHLDDTTEQWFSACVLRECTKAASLEGA